MSPYELISSLPINENDDNVTSKFTIDPNRNDLYIRASHCISHSLCKTDRLNKIGKVHRHIVCFCSKVRHLPVMVCPNVGTSTQSVLLLVQHRLAVESTLDFLGVPFVGFRFELSDQSTRLLRLRSIDRSEAFGLRQSPLTEILFV